MINCKYCHSKLKVQKTNDEFIFYECPNKKCKVTFKCLKEESNDKSDSRNRK